MMAMGLVLVKFAKIIFAITRNGTHKNIPIIPQIFPQIANDKTIKNVTDFINIVKNTGKGKVLRILLKRGDFDIFIALTNP